MLSVPLCGVGCDLALGELTHHLAEHLVLLAQLPAHGFLPWIDDCATLTKTKVVVHHRSGGMLGA